jgi:hypothetical protein
MFYDPLSLIVSDVATAQNFTERHRALAGAH